MTKTVLFMPLCAGVAHAGRMLTVAYALREQFDGSIEFAGSGQYANLFPEAGFRFHELESDLPKTGRVYSHEQAQSPKEWRAVVKKRMSFGSTGLWGLIRRLIDNELALYKSLKPDLVVWDGRASVCISAPAAGIPFVSVANSFYLPKAAHSMWTRGFPLTFPLLAKYSFLRHLVANLPLKIQQRLFESLLKFFLRLMLRPLNGIRSDFHLNTLHNLSDLVTSLGTVIIPEPQLEPLLLHEQLPKNFHYVGPLTWQPDISMPEPLKDLQRIIYVTMGMTGNPRIFKTILESLSSTHRYPVAVSVGNMLDPKSIKALPENIHVHNLLPGIDVAKRSRLVICHGAIGTVGQALSQGVPVIGIPALPQHEMVIDWVEALGAGSKLYPFDLTPERVRRTVEGFLVDEAHHRAAQALAPYFDLKAGPRRAASVILNQLKGGCDAEG